MDPDATLGMLIDEAVKGNPWQLLEHAADLAEWLERGGYAPKDPRKVTA